MIGSIRGKVLSIEGFTALIECNTGLGYEVQVPATVLPSLKVEQECFLYVHHVVREDASLLYGFASLESRLLFRELLKLKGIGAKVALALLSTFTLNEFISAINQNRVNALATAPGVGKKTAERIVMEMKDRVGRLRLQEQALVADTPAAVEESSVGSPFACDDAIAALVSLGYKEAVAMSAVKAVYEEGMDTEQIIVLSLSQLSKR